MYQRCKTEEWEAVQMRKRKVTTCMILLLMAAALTGFMLYTSYVKEQQQAKRGTLVRRATAVRDVTQL